MGNTEPTDDDKLDRVLENVKLPPQDYPQSSIDAGLRRLEERMSGQG